MAQPMMHLLIADKIYSEKSGSIHSYGDFLLGCIAPDAVHVKENLVHLLSDMIWYHSVRVPFKEEFLKAPLQNMSMNEAYYADCEQLEQVMFWRRMPLI